MLYNKFYKPLMGALFILLWAVGAIAQNVWLEAEAFADKGGWVIDQQFILNMGSPYLMAHGNGRPVKPATTTAQFTKEGNYFVWVRTKDWAPFPQGPGKFKVAIGADTVHYVFGTGGRKGWLWQKAPQTIKITAGTKNISLIDLTGFAGRADALYFTTSKKDVPPSDSAALYHFRLKMLNITKPDTATYQFAVVGGGMAGLTAAIQAARLGVKTVLVHDRPVLGGNNSSETRVHLMGDVNKNHYPRLGRIVRELDNGDPGNSNVDGELYGDKRKYDVAKDEPNLTLMLNNFAYKVETKNGKIISVQAMEIASNKRTVIKANYFADCTGDGTIGALAGADYRMGREAKAETNESMAVDAADNFTMGFSNMWNTYVADKPMPYPQTPWALQFSDEYHHDITRADWTWETGFGNFDPIAQAEEIRDHNFRAIYGNWSYLKNNKPEKYGNIEFKWVAFVSGKRESRRLLGDLILTENDVKYHKLYDDGFVTCTWALDLHYPDPENTKYFKGQEFISTYEHPKYKPYPIPYRCLYSRNINNLFMAGRNISVTHVALGTVRVMRTTGMMGELVGMAVAVANKNNCTPREVYQLHLPELKELVGPPAKID